MIKAMGQNRTRKDKWMRMISLSFIICHLSFSLSACSEDDATEDEYADWQQRNEAYFAAVASDSLGSTGSRSQWLRLKSFALDQDSEGQATDYVYVKKLVEGSGSDSPRYTDSVRVAYQKRLMPTSAHPEGYVFDTTIYGDFDLKTAATAKFLTSGTVDGFCTALMYMHRGDRWRIYIPHQLGYGSTVQSGVPAYSTLIFDVELVDFSPAGTAMPSWKAARR